MQRTKDGVVVVVHDADLMRLAGDVRKIAETDYAAFAGVRLDQTTGRVGTNGGSRVSTSSWTARTDASVWPLS